MFIKFGVSKIPVYIDIAVPTIAHVTDIWDVNISGSFTGNKSKYYSLYAL